VSGVTVAYSLDERRDDDVEAFWPPGDQVAEQTDPPDHAAQLALSTTGS
jgi:hypothetical protein